MGSIFGRFKKLKLDTRMQKVKFELNGLIVTDEQLRRHMDEFLRNINLGLGKHTHAEANVKCYQTFVQALPDGSERGKFLALDLGGTNFRVLLIELGEHCLFKMQSRIYVLPPQVVTGTATQLNDHIAACLSDFIHRYGVAEQYFPLGYTFSFPVMQRGLTQGVLQRWTKGFSASGAVGQDVVQQLRDALRRRGDVDIRVFAILNDTTGTLMSCAWRHTDCKIGLIVGTGSNACYVERIENVELCEDKSKPYMIINTEMGAFGENGCLDFLMTEYDLAVDSASINPGRQRHEKLISGMYLNEIIRLVLVDLVEKKLLFGGNMPEQLIRKDSFQSRHMSDIEGDKGSHNECRRIVQGLGVRHVTDHDCEVVEYVCKLVAVRSAHLTSAAMATLLNKMDFKNVTLGIDGSVYRYHPLYHGYMMEKMSQLVNKDIKFQLVLSQDGSGRGAAIVAAVASKEQA